MSRPCATALPRAVGALVAAVALAACGPSRVASVPEIQVGSDRAFGIAEHDLPTAEERWTPAPAGRAGACRARTWRDVAARAAQPDEPTSDLEMTFDEQGRITRARAAGRGIGGTTIETFTYDPRTGRALTRTLDYDLGAGGTRAQGREVWTYRYDIDPEARTIVRRARRTDVPDGSGEPVEEDVTTFAYDDRGRVVSVAPAGQDGLVCTYDGDRVASRRSGAIEIAYGYDGDGHLVAIRQRALAVGGAAAEEIVLVLRREGSDAVTARALAPSSAGVALALYEGDCAPTIFDPCAPALAPAPP